MIKNFILNFNKLPLSNKAMIYLMWIYNAGNIISGLFISIYIFSLNKNILDVIIYNAIFVTAIIIGFSFLGYLMSILKKNIKYMYYFAYSFYIFAFLIIFLMKGYNGIYIFSCIYGLGMGMFWCAVHTQELVHIEDKTRDIYSSIINSGKNIINIIVPLLVSFIFFIVNKYFSFNPYIILFLLLPFVYFTSFLFIKDIGDYIPNKIKKVDIVNFFNFRKYFWGHLYFLLVGFYQGILWILTPVIAIIILKTEINVGIFEGLIQLLSVFIIIFLADKRNIQNRVKIMGILAFLLFINFSIFTLNFNIYGYIIFTLIGLILNPLYRVSEHVFDLRLMDSIKIPGSDFYPAMLFREVFLWIGRVSIMGFLLILYKYHFSNIGIIKIGLILVGIFMIFAWLSVYRQLKNEDN